MKVHRKGAVNNVDTQVGKVSLNPVTADVDNSIFVSLVLLLRQPD